MDSFREDELDPGIIVLNWDGPQPTFTTYGFSPPRNRWFAERLLRHLRSIHNSILAPQGHIPKAMLRDLVAASPDGLAMLGYEPQTQPMLAGNLLVIADFDYYANAEECEGIIPELAWRAPIYAGGDPQSEITFWKHAKLRCTEFFQQTPDGAKHWGMKEKKFLRYADARIEALRDEIESQQAQP